jgi:glycosyltransferase involved in cell wall biosynthesis
MAMNKILFFDNHDFVSFPFGGTLSFARHLIKCSPQSFALVGVTKDATHPVGRWTKIDIQGESVDFFAYRSVDEHYHSSKIPQRFYDYWHLKKHMGKIRSSGAKKALVQAQSAILPVAHEEWDQLCIIMPGVYNIASMSRFVPLRFLKKPYEFLLYRNLRKASSVLAAADDRAISDFVNKSRGVLRHGDVKSYPTVVDHQLYDALDRDGCRNDLGIDPDDIVFIYCARVTYSKGWPLVADAFIKLLSERNNVRLVVLGDGDDFDEFRSKIHSAGCDDQVAFKGLVSSDQVRKYLTASDIFVNASYIEGWSVSMVEALVSGCAIVTTDVSGAIAMVHEGKNGFIIKDRKSATFADGMLKACELKTAASYSKQLSDSYNAKYAYKNLLELWGEDEQ